MGLISDWLDKNPSGTEHDIIVCDCCGDSDDWYSTPGEHDYDIQPVFNCM
jgi:hypothetical protein